MATRKRRWPENIDPRKVRTKSASEAGRAVESIVHDRVTLFSGSRRDLPNELIKVLFHIARSRAEQCDALEVKVNNLEARLSQLEKTAVIELPENAIETLKDNE